MTARFEKRKTLSLLLTFAGALCLWTGDARQAGAEPLAGNRVVTGNKLSKAAFAGEIGFRNATYDLLKQTYHYPWLYPQSFTIDRWERELFVMIGARSGQNKWGWVQVYDLDTFRLKTTFSTGQHWHEGMSVQRIGGRRYLFTVGDKSLIRVDITNFPKDLEVVKPEALPVPGYSLMASDGTGFAVQERPGAQGPSGPQQFKLYDARLGSIGRVTLAFSNGKQAAVVPAGSAKMQGIAWDGQRFYAGFGAAHLSGTAKGSNEDWQGNAVFDRNGALLASNLMPPIDMLASLQKAIGYQPTCVENEGIQNVDGAIYSMWVTLGPKQREARAYEGKGIVLMRESYVTDTRHGYQR